MEIIQVNVASGAYPVNIGSGILTDVSLWQKYLGRAKALIVSNEVVAPIYLEKLRSSLPGHVAAVHVIPDGEIHKNIETWAGIIDQLVNMNARRDDIVIALGGGVVGDIAGFAAASYMRGIRFLQVPTTLLAQVDASVGGKTGINHAKGKNLIGAFHQPAAVVIDAATLTTLPEREFNAGLAEVVKYGAIMDREFFDWLETSARSIRARETTTLHHLIRQSVSNKAKIVAADEREAGVRALLNFGHSFAHALETVTAYTEFLHGEAVAIGMVIAAQLSELRSLCGRGAKDRLARLLQGFDLAVELPRTVTTGALIEAIELDKKGLAGARRLILLTTVGEALIDDQSTDEQIATAIEQCR